MSDKRKNSHERLKKLILTAVFAALAYISLFLTLYFPKVSGFLTLDIKDAVIALGAMFLGPIAAIVISLIVSLVEMVTLSTTEFWGFLMNFLGSAVFASVASWIYKYKKTFWGGLIGLACGSLSMVAVMILCNLFIIPLYTPGVTTEVVAGMIMPVLLPFNAIKALLNASLVMLLYKPISNALKASHAIARREDERLTIDLKTLIVMACALAIAVASVLILLFAL